jgi:hypothetical protein
MGFELSQEWKIWQRAVNYFVSNCI